MTFLEFVEGIFQPLCRIISVAVFFLSRFIKDPWDKAENERWAIYMMLLGMVSHE